MADGLLESAPVMNDIRYFGPPLDIAASAAGVVGGFPCQGISKSGKQLGLQDPRSALIKSVFDVIDSCPYLQLSAQLDARSGSCFGNAQLTDPYFISGHLLFWRTLRPCSAPNCVVCGPTS
ncbi:unnamed protein product [Durusdinium trenchii]|uniref:DNA (cytosine-5-)-methyltransferase n=1 Tax=Durusdinium trenchii TaxID=1381693 RepID=A0ABP0P2H7_9DINO